METPKRIPLASGLIGHKAGSTNGQLEVSLINYETINITIWRKAFCGLPDVEFSIAKNDLPDIIEILEQAREKSESNYWATQLAAKVRSGKSETT